MINKKRLTFREWIDAAGWPPIQVWNAWEAWKAGEDPTEYRAIHGVKTREARDG